VIRDRDVQNLVGQLCGRVAECGFDFLGYLLVLGRLTLARAMVERFLEPAHRLYEQDRVLERTRRPLAPPLSAGLP
jgi:hypothetical protein